MAPIYSHQLHNHAYSAPTSGVVYTVPPGSTVVVTDVDFLFEATAMGEFFDVTLGACIVLFFQSAGTLTQLLQWRGKQVLNAGDTISVLSQGPAATIGITGYVLS